MGRDVERETGYVQLIPAPGWWAIWQWPEIRANGQVVARHLRDPLVAFARKRTENTDWRSGHADDRYDIDVVALVAETDPPGMIGEAEGDALAGFWHESQGEDCEQELLRIHRESVTWPQSVEKYRRFRAASTDATA